MDALFYLYASVVVASAVGVITVLIQRSIDREQHTEYSASGSAGPLSLFVLIIIGVHAGGNAYEINAAERKKALTENNEDETVSLIKQVKSLDKKVTGFDKRLDAIELELSTRPQDANESQEQSVGQKT